MLQHGPPIRQPGQGVRARRLGQQFLGAGPLRHLAKQPRVRLHQFTGPLGDALLQLVAGLLQQGLGPGGLRIAFHEPQGHGVEGGDQLLQLIATAGFLV